MLSHLRKGHVASENHGKGFSLCEWTRARRPERPRSGSEREEETEAVPRRARARMSPMRAVNPFLQRSPELRSFGVIHPVSRRNFLPGRPAQCQEEISHRDGAPAPNQVL